MAKAVVVTKSEMSHLESYFPDLDQGRKGSKPAGWKSRVEVKFMRGRQVAHVVRVDHYSTTWTWGNLNGDFRAKPGLARYLAQLETKAK